MNWKDGYAAVRPLTDDGLWLALARLTFGRGRIIISTEDTAGEHW